MRKFMLFLFCFVLCLYTPTYTLADIQGVLGVNLEYQPCLNYGVCILQNLTVIGGYFNVSVTNYNITGTATADDFCTYSGNCLSEDYLMLDQTIPQTITGGRPTFNDGMVITDGNGYSTYFYHSYGTVYLDLTEGCYLCFDPYCYYYIDGCYGYTNLAVDYAYYADSANYANYADYANTAGSATSATNSDTVDNIHASSTATANYLYPLNSAGNMYLTKTNPKSGLVESTTGRSLNLSKTSVDDTAEQTNEILSYTTLPNSIDVESNVVGTMSATDYGTVHSIFFWVKDLESGIKVLLGDGVSNAVFFDVRYLRYSTGNIFGDSTNYIAGSGWSRFAIVRNGASLKFYRNGINTYSTNSATGSFNGIDEFLQFSSFPSYIYDGKIDELVIYSDAKDQAFITADYNSGAGRYAATSDSNVLNIWHLDEGTGTALTDSKSGVTITLNQTPTWETGEKSVNGGNTDVTIWKHTGNSQQTESKGFIEFGEDNIDYYSLEYADIKPKIYSQAIEPNITNNSFSFWRNSTDSKYFMILNINGTQKKVELT